MADNIEIPERVADDDREARDRGRPRRKRRWGLMLLLLLVGLPLALFALWSWITLSFSYSRGERAGYQQKISEKGWLCRTWEGEIAVTALPGAAPEIFSYTVRDDSVAHVLERLQGQRVSLTYEQHRFVPTSCFGETEYFVSGVRPINDPLMQGQVPGVPGGVPQYPTPQPVPPPPQPAPPTPTPATPPPPRP